MEQSQPLVCPSHTTHYVAMFVIGALVGAGASYMYGASNYQKGFDAAKNLVEKSTLAPMIQTPQDIRSLSGSVTAINGNTITLRADSTNPFEDQNLLDRTVTISATTKITKLVQKDPKVFQAEMDAFVKSPSVAAAGGVPAIPPMLSSRISGTAQDIKVGDIITVSATGNIKTAKSFDASTIEVQQKLVVPSNM